MTVVSHIRWETAERWDDIGIAIVQLDDDGTILKCNEAFADVFHDSPNQLAGKSVVSLSPESEHERIRLNLADMRDGNVEEVRQLRRYEDRFGNVVERMLHTVCERDDVGNDYAVSLIYKPGADDGERYQLLKDVLQHLQPASSGSQVFHITGQDMSDNRNQSVNAGGNANAHNGLTSRELKIIVVAMVVTTALAFRYRLMHNDGRVEATPQAVETHKE